MKYNIAIYLNIEDEIYRFITSKKFDTKELAYKWYEELNFVNEYDQPFDVFIEETDENNNIVKYETI